MHKIWLPFCLVFLYSITASAQLDPNDRPMWSQGWFLDFEETGDDVLDVQDFDCDNIPVFEKVANPLKTAFPTSYPGEIYNSNNVGKITTTACAWEGVHINNEFILDFSRRNRIEIDVLPPAADRKVAVKIEDFNDNSINKQVEAMTVTPDEWQTLVFDFAGTESGKYGRIVIFMDFDGTNAGEVWYFDNVRQTQPPITYDDGLIEDFETPNRIYWGDWNMNEDFPFEIIENPDTTGGNHSNLVGSFYTTSEQWEGACTAEPITPFDFSEGAVFRMKVYCDEIDRQATLKLENLYNKTDNPLELSVLTTIDFEWHELVFDFSTFSQISDPAFSGFYGRVTVFPDFFSTEEGGEWYIDDIYFDGLHTGVKESKPSVFHLYAQNYPNPFNPGTTINYSIPHQSMVRLTVYNTLGEEVATLVDEQKSAGYHDVYFDGSDLPTGLYFYRLSAGDLIVTNKMLLVK